MSSHKKQPSFSPEYHESSQFEDNDKTSSSRLLEAVRLGLSVLALFVAVVIVGTSAYNLKVYNQTHVSEDFQLPLWPFNFNLGPTIALVACGAIMIVSNAVSIAVSKLSSLRYNASINTFIILGSAFAGLVSAIVATSFFYGVNASDVAATIQSWSCLWADVEMDSEPHFGRICKQAKASLYLTIVMIPLHVIVGVVGIMTVVKEKKSATMAERKGSPALS